MSEEQTKYYINITKEKLEGVDGISVELSDDEEIAVAAGPDEELENGKKITIVSDDDYSVLADELETITTQAQDWVATQIDETIRKLVEGTYQVPYCTNSGGLKNNSTNETVTFDQVKGAVDGYLSKDRKISHDGIMVNEVIDVVYPVGSVYISAGDVSPQQMFGGLWEKIEGRFLLGSSQSYGLGLEGGFAEVTLGVEHMPSHTHTQNSHTHTQKAHNHTQNSHNHTQNAHYHSMTGNKTTTFSSGSKLRVGADDGTKGSKNTASTTATNKATTATNKEATAVNNATTATNQNTGGGQAHTNMPPFLAVNIWKRTG